MKKIIITLAALCFITCAYSQAKDDFKETLKQMLEISGSQKTFTAAITQILTMYKQNKPDIPAEVWAEVETELTRTSLDDLVEMLTPVYQKHLTKDDLLKIIEFYRTPAGRKYAEKTPMIMQESMQVGQQWGMRMGSNVAEKLKEKGY